MAKEKYNLISGSKEELITLINELMNKLSEKERIEFVSKWISPEEALIEAGAYDSDCFIRSVEEFCKKCIDGQYYNEPDYDSYHDYYSYEEGEDFEDYSESEWAAQFTELLKTSIMFARNRNYDVAYKAFETLMQCLNEAEFDEEIFGIDNPRDYIDIDWNELFERYYISMKNQISNEEQAAVKAIELWISFGEMCTKGMLNNFKDNHHMEKVIRENIEDNGEAWGLQHSLYELLKNFYLVQNLEFDEIIVAKSLVCYNPNFLNDVAQGYINIKMWDEAVKAIDVAMKEVQNEYVISALNKKLVDCFEKLNKFNEAYDVSVKMFKNDNSHELYLRARNLAVKTDELQSFIGDMLSFVKSLIYRALRDKNIKFSNLQEFIQDIEDNNIDGIVGMVKNPKDCGNEKQLLNSSIDILKEMVQFHIKAAKRNRYARAAYYCSIIKDIYTYMNEKEKFDQYYSKILSENRRRPALKDEMEKKVF